MTERWEQVGELMREMELTEPNIERRKKYVGFGPQDARRVTALKDLLTRGAGEYTTVFFDYLSPLEEARELLANRVLLDRARQLKSEHIGAMAQGEYGPKYVEQRLTLGSLYSRVGLPPRVFLGAFHHLLTSIGGAIMKHFQKEPLEGYEHFMSLKKLGFFDITLIVDVLIFERERVIRRQQQAISDLSTPVLQFRERLLILPIVGVIDTQRARQLTENLLQAIRVNRAKVVVIDITGVAAVDSKVANHLVQTVSAARLMGAIAIVTGLSADVAQTLVTLGVDLSKINTVGDLQGGIEEAERLIGYRVELKGSESARPSPTS